MNPLSCFSLRYDRTILIPMYMHRGYMYIILYVNRETSFLIQQS